MLETSPAVFAVENEYHIMVAVKSKCLMWVRVGNENFYDDSNGILKSDVEIHKMIVPAKKLNKEKKYVICARKVIDRQPYFSKTSEVFEYEYNFDFEEKENLRAYHIADTHVMTEPAVKAAKAFGDIDFLILNGDIVNDADSRESVLDIYRIIEKITFGAKPVVFARGNHDMRGKSAEKFVEFTPNYLGNSYFTFRLGKIWGIVLDCGEDKQDDNEAYGNTICCHDFRMRVTEFLKKTAQDGEYLSPQIKHKIVVCHIPFTRKSKELFNIEEDVYAEWVKVLREEIKPDIILCGHIHKIALDLPGGEKDAYKMPCKMLIGAESEFYDPKESDVKKFTGAGLCFGEKEITAQITNCAGEILDRFELKTY